MPHFVSTDNLLFDSSSSVQIMEEEGRFEAEVAEVEVVEVLQQISLILFAPN